MSRIHVDATKCPHCQTQFDADTMDAGRREVRNRTRRALALFVAILLTGLAWLLWPGNVERLGQRVGEIDRPG